MAGRAVTELQLAGCGSRALREMARAALALVDQTQRWADAGQSVLQVLIGDAVPLAWQHHPDGDVRDRRSGYRWYYHCHAEQRPVSEHGHFHLFSEHHGGGRDTPTLTHLAAIGVDARGLPIRAFTVNRWVTDEVWRDARQVLRLLRRFRLDDSGPLADVSRWLMALTALFTPQLASVIVQRDAFMQLRARSGNRPNLRDDRRLEVLSQCRLSLPQQIQAIDVRLDQLRRRTSRTSPATLALSQDSTHEFPCACSAGSSSESLGPR